MDYRDINRRHALHSQRATLQSIKEMIERGAIKPVKYEHYYQALAQQHLGEESYILGNPLNVLKKNEDIYLIEFEKLSSERVKEVVSSLRLFDNVTHRNMFAGNNASDSEEKGVAFLIDRFHRAPGCSDVLLLMSEAYKNRLTDLLKNPQIYRMITPPVERAI